MGFLDTVIKESGNEFASVVSEGVAAGDITSYVDTGSYICLLYTSPSPRDKRQSRMPSSA